MEYYGIIIIRLRLGHLATPKGLFYFKIKEKPYCDCDDTNHRRRYQSLLSWLREKTSINILYSTIGNQI